MNTRNTSFLTRVGAVITLAAIFLVPPLAIVRLIGRPWPSWARLTDEFDAGRITTDTTMRIAALASLVVWAWTMLVIIRDVRIVLRERRDAGYVAPAAPGSAGWVQRLVRIALAGSMTTAATVTALAPAASLTLVQQFSPLRADTPAPMIVTELDEGFAVATPEREVTTVVATGRQTPLSLAVDLGDETLRDEIIALNHSPEWSGGVFPAGMEIRVPKVEVVTETEVVASPAPVPQPPAPPSAARMSCSPATACGTSPKRSSVTAAATASSPIRCVGKRSRWASSTTPRRT
jgi:hypothetical protein